MMRLPTRLSRFLMIAMVALLAGCATGGLRINNEYTARGQDSRSRYIVVHYTAGESARALQVLTTGEVSAHYLIDNNASATIYQLVDESRRAWHAGDSEWEGRNNLNASSIGIELVNRGFQDTPAGRVWYPFPQAQIDALILLLKDIKQRQGITGDHILGHSDIAPQRKLDPGPLFPWHQLAAAGVIDWPPQALVDHRLSQLGGVVPPVNWFQEQLARIGYSIEQTGEFDEQTKNVIAAFQMRYRQSLYDGQPDLETAAWLMSLPAPR